MGDRFTQQIRINRCSIEVKDKEHFEDLMRDHESRILVVNVFADKPPLQKDIIKDKKSIPGQIFQQCVKDKNWTIVNISNDQYQDVKEKYKINQNASTTVFHGKDPVLEIKHDELSKVQQFIDQIRILNKDYQ